MAFAPMHVVAAGAAVRRAAAAAPSRAAGPLLSEMEEIALGKEIAVGEAAKAAGGVALMGVVLGCDGERALLDDGTGVALLELCELGGATRSLALQQLQSGALVMARGQLRVDPDGPLTVVVTLLNDMHNDANAESMWIVRTAMYGRASSALPPSAS
jgi:hypothetical protein